MRHNTENLLDNALLRLKNGEDISAVIASCPSEYQKDLTQSLALAGAFQGLHLKTVPTPTKRRMYLANLQAEAGSRFAYWKSLLTGRNIVAGLATFLILAISTVYAAANSLPGDTLFSLKKTYENGRLHLALSQESKVRFAIDLADQRLQDAQKIIAQNSDQQTQSAALNELSQQTNAALSSIKDAAAANSSVAKDPNTLKHAENLAKAQQQLLAKADPATASKKGTDAQKTLNDIKQIIAAANEQTAAALPAKDFSITGNIVSMSNQNTSLVIGKDTYYVDANTIITDKNGIGLSFISLSIDEPITVKGLVTDGKNIAQTILVLGKVKSERIEAKPKASVAGQASAAPTVPTSAKVQDNKIPEPQQPAKPLDTIGTFIPDSPATAVIR